jgi:hypothetical protein
MFQSLSDQQPHPDSKERLIRYCVVAAISVILFAALYFGVPAAG